jgi:hypothetical protein
VSTTRSNGSSGRAGGAGVSDMAGAIAGEIHRGEGELKLDFIDNDDYLYFQDCD